MPNQYSRPKRILIVDDEPTLVFFLKQGLQESQLAYLVDGASSGEEALTKLTYNMYDLLVTDLKMPGISGFTLVEVARSLHPNINVILMTAFGSREVQDESEQLKVNGYLIKPFPTAQLQEMIKEILMMKEATSPSLAAEQNLSHFPLKKEG
jgi:YesN/AraC family two-component response regulator